MFSLSFCFFPSSQGILFVCIIQLKFLFNPYSHGLPSSIVSDRGSAFASAVWARICQLLGIERRLSSAYHPETDGGTERWNAVVEAFLRIYINYQRNDWHLWLPHCELALNCRTSSSTDMTPFFLDRGYDLKVVQCQRLRLGRYLRLRLRIRYRRLFTVYCLLFIHCY